MSSSTSLDWEVSFTVLVIHREGQSCLFMGHLEVRVSKQDLSGSRANKGSYYSKSQVSKWRRNSHKFVLTYDPVDPGKERRAPVPERVTRFLPQERTLNP
jgi:hypothetical protein